MIVAELLALLGILGAAGLGITSIVSWSRRSATEQQDRQRRSKQMNSDLRSALESRDHRRLDDWMIIYDDLAHPDVKEHVKIRRDELFVDSHI